MNTLTDNEKKVLQAINDSEYGDYLRDPIWSWSIADNSDLSPSSIPGIVSSLSKKGLVRCDGEGADRCVSITEAGAKAFVAHVGTPTKPLFP